MEAAIEKNTNDELKKLQLKLSILEEQLRQALSRAETAEQELEKYKSQELTKKDSPIAAVLPPTLPPPPPPPLPANLLYKAPAALNIFNCNSVNAASNANASSLPDSSFSDRIAQHNLHRTNDIGGGQKLIETVKQQVQPEATTGRSLNDIILHNQQKHIHTHTHTHTTCTFIYVHVYVL